MVSEIIMHAAVSSVNVGLNVNPSAEKKSFDFFRSLTGKLTKIWRGICVGEGDLQSTSLPIYCPR